MKAQLIFRHTPCNWHNGITGIGSWLIRKITRCDYDHVEVLLYGDICISATFNGVIGKDLHRWEKLYKNQRSIVRQINTGHTQKDIKMAYEITEGIKYDYWSLVCHLVYRITGKWIGRGKDGKNRFYCSEWCAYALGIDKWYRKDVKRLYEMTF